MFYLFSSSWKFRVVTIILLQIFLAPCMIKLNNIIIAQFHEDKLSIF